MKNTRKKPRHTKAGREIIAGLREIVSALESGRRLTGRIYSGPLEVVKPGSYDSAAIAATRRKLQVSQSVFAQLVGVSTDLVQSWEQGKRLPHATARRILDEINHQPRRWTRMIRGRAA